MALKDYYLILGIPRSESEAGIRAAYRDLVKRYHPDVAGTADAGRFRELAEAYEVLSDPDRRRYYNRDLQQSEHPVAPGVRTRSEAEPFPAARSIFDRADRVRPSLDEFFDRYVRNFSGYRIPKAEHVEGLNIEVVLTLAEAIRGGALPVTLPVFQTCPDCNGTGETWLFPCIGCRAQGLIEQNETVTVEIPPMVRPGTVVDLPLRGLGIHNFYLRVHVLIGES